MLSLSLVLLLPASTQQYGNALRLTGHQYFSNGTGIAYFDDGTTQPFKHMITSANGYYFDNSTIFYTGEIPGLSSERGVKCDTGTTRNTGIYGNRTNIVNVTIIRGADLIENKSKALEPSPVIESKQVCSKVEK